MKEETLVVRCKCGNWEEQPADQQRHHIQSFKHVTNTSNGNAYYICNECGESVVSTIVATKCEHCIVGVYFYAGEDGEGKPIIEADPRYVFDTSRSTNLKKGDAEVHTTEHVLAALFGMEIDNALIDVDGPEIPIMDGSAYPFVALINEVGIEEQNTDKDYFVVTENLTYEDLERQTEMLLVPQDEFRLTVNIYIFKKIKIS